MPAPDGTAPGDLPDRLLLPHPDRIASSHPGFGAVVAAHRAALMAGRPVYLDPLTGFEVMTSLALLQRGSCCSSGCRHCPFASRPGD